MSQSERDNDIVDRIRHRDESALEECIVAYLSAVEQAILRRAGDQAQPPDVEEAAQDVFVIVWNDISKYDPARAPFVAWVIMIAKYRALALRRALSIRHRREQVGLPSDVREADLEDMTDSIVDGIDREQDKEILRRNLGHLTRVELQLLYLRFVKGLSFRQISNLLGVNENTLRQRMTRLIRKFRRFFQGK